MLLSHEAPWAAPVKGDDLGLERGQGRPFEPARDARQEHHPEERQERRVVRLERDDGQQQDLDGEQ